MSQASLDDERRDRLRLIRSANIGPVSYHQLLARFGSAARALAAIPDLATRGGGKPPSIASVGDIDREIARVAALGARYLFAGEAFYPARLRELDNAPPVLIVRGTLSLLDRPTVAIVGARNASAAACRFARGLAHDLVGEGCLIVSGLARGIDTAAHQGAIADATAGVIACGIDIVFPAENRDLQEQVATRGVLIAEQPPGTQPLARHFPYRNRIIAGMSIGTIVVEAAPRSGSLITARLANEAGREVMAVPGSPADPRAQGCNSLIRDGATLIQNAADVMETIRPIAAGVRAHGSRWSGAPPEERDPDSAERATVVALLGYVPVSVDEVVRQSGLSTSVVATVLLELELGGRLERHAGGRVSLS